MAELTVGSLFSGIGGLDLGLERAGMKVIWQSEIDPFANKVLKKHWPEVVNHGNIKEIDWETVERPNVICGGYPCQPFSTAGKRRGEEDPRHLWPWVRDSISRLRPDYAILENVRGHLTLGGLSVIGDLASIGYDAEWRIVSAASVGANHRRDRIIIVAYPTSKCCNGVNHHSRDCQQSKTTAQFGNGGGSENVAYPNDRRFTSRSSETESQPHRCCIDVPGNRNDTTINRGISEHANVAYPNDSRGGASTSGTNRDRSEEIKGRQDESQSWTCRCCSDVADSDCCDEANGRQCEDVQSQNRSGRDDRGGSRSNPRQVSVGSAGQNFSNVAHANLRQTGGGIGSVSTGSRLVFAGQNYERGAQGYAGWEWWQTEPDVGRVAHGVPNRVDRLRGLGNAVVPQVAEVIGRLVVAHAGTA